MPSFLPFAFAASQAGLGAIFMQDEAGHLIGKYDGAGNLMEETIWLGEIQLATL